MSSKLSVSLADLRRFLLPISGVVGVTAALGIAMAVLLLGSVGGAILIARPPRKSRHGHWLPVKQRVHPNAYRLLAPASFHRDPHMSAGVLARKAWLRVAALATASFICRPHPSYLYSSGSHRALTAPALRSHHNTVAFIRRRRWRRCSCP